MNTEEVQTIVPDLERYIERELDRQRVVGAAVGIVADQQLAWARGFGLADIGEGRRADEDTLFRIDSNTKPFTGTAIMQLRDGGKLDVNDPVVKYVPEFERAEIRHGTIADVTLRRLLTHRAGLMGEVPSEWSTTGVGPTRDEVLGSLDRVGIVIPPDSQHKYCNLGFILLGLVIERLSGTEYADYIHQNILEPLGMAATTFDPDALKSPRVVQYYGPEYEEAPEPAVKLVHNGRRPAGGIYSTVTDMARWLSLQFRTEALERVGAQVLAGTTIEEMHRPQYVEPDWEAGQCMPWRAVRSGEHVYLGHGGGNAGSHSQTYFSKRRRVGVVVLTNTDNHTAHLDVAKETMDRLMAAAEASHEIPFSTVPVPTPQELRPFTGLYATHRPNSRVRIAWMDGALALLDGSITLPRELDTSGGTPTPARLAPTERPLVFRVREGRLAGETVAFEMGADGRASGFTLQIGTAYRRLVPAE